jgi:hypothetical protein
LHEGFDLGWESQGSITSEQNDQGMAGANVWLAESDLPGFKAQVLAY